jgi:hypothetical protein
MNKFLSILSTMLSNKIFMETQMASKSGYYKRFTGKSKNFKKNKRKGL